jgi:beta-glucosidase/6-phospho-beta-glucosidase/beta-galactosidase/ABC-type amino acid transport substrate-binding protein
VRGARASGPKNAAMKRRSVGRRAAPFPPGFLFGVATADHQCEAYDPAREDVRDRFEAVRALTPRGRATDFGNRYPEDARLAAGLGCTAFRLSLAWSRLEPEPGVWDEAAFAHYRRVLVTLRAAGLEPFVTLHHNTWPVHVEERGGMVADAFPDWFEAYAREVATRLGDLITYYVTLNEPNQLVFGYIKPWWSRAYPVPPGLPRGADNGAQIGKVGLLIPNLFRANARARRAIKAAHRDVWHDERAQVGANPLLLGLPPWLQRIIDTNATRLRKPADLGRQARRLTERRLLESGRADVVLAQLTLTYDRTDHALFSETYYVTSLALLARGTAPSEAEFATWRGRIAVTRGTTAEDAVRARFGAATVVPVAGPRAAVDLLRGGGAELVLGDDAELRPFADAGLELVELRGPGEPYAAAVAPGNRDLLDAVDRAIRAFKQPDASGVSPWQRAMQTHLGDAPGAAAPRGGRRANLADLSANAPAQAPAAAPGYDASALRRTRRRNTLTFAIRPGIAGLCTRTGSGYTGLEPDLARFVAARVCGAESAVRFVEVAAGERVAAVRSPLLRLLDPVLRVVAIFSTLITTNWWYLGLAGKLAPFLCPADCVGELDYVGLDYYWGIDSLRINRILHLFAASEQRYANAPVWPTVLRAMLHEHAALFPGKPLFVIENGCVGSADRVTREAYLRLHIAEVQRARHEGVPVAGYLCWSITSNREWGLPFDENSDFGLYHIELDTDPALTRVATPAAEAYRAIIAERSAHD